MQLGGMRAADVERLVGETCGTDRLFDRPSMSLCILYSCLEGYASSLALHNPPLLQNGVKRRRAYTGGGFADVGLTGLNCRGSSRFYGGCLLLFAELHTNCPVPSCTKKAGKENSPQ